MMNTIRIKKLSRFGLFLSFVFFVSPPISFAKIITEFTPTASISEEYTDNYNQTENNTDDEFLTEYNLGLSLAFIGKTSSFTIAYNPGYTDYSQFDENDSWQHEATINGNIQTSRNTTLTLSENWLRDFSRSERTNNFVQHDTNTTTIGITHQFGTENYLGADYSYSFDDYDIADVDEYTSHTPSFFLNYWFNQNYGFDLNGYYEKTDYELGLDDSDTWFGELRLLKRITRHFNLYLGYAHTYTDEEITNHTIYNPSFGFDWQPTEDSGISLGLGILMQEWDNPDSDSEDFFINLDAYKDFNLSPRSTLSITGASGYEPTDSEAASLGFNISYRAGALYTYQITRYLTADLSGSYEITQYDEPRVDRKDNTMSLSAGLGWMPLRWLNLNLNYRFNDFDTDDATREDYQENVIRFTVSFTPVRPVRGTDPAGNSRQELENRVFN